ncbi:MAG TPA: PSD1 and planctomycete cytochrome C domain-containing protein [Tepidisphaeraceae bacterium]
MIARVRFAYALGCLLVMAASARAETSLAQLLSSPDTIDFVRDIQPILRTNCYKCHGPEKQKALLRWDSKDSALLHGGQSGPEILAGKSADSRLIQRVIGGNGEDRMPLNSPALSEAEINTLTKWIDHGAIWPDTASIKDSKIERHWAYVKPVRPTAPTVNDAAWVHNPIDAFVLAGLQSKGLKASPKADRPALLRRVSLDLIGLPPSIKEVDDFVNDPSPNAYEKVVDRLLASKHFGERAATRWLDLARYADSNGYEKDRRRSMWPYRDWVINALNADMPFDQFTIEQLAGDLLPNATEQQKIATGFNRNTMLNEEGGVDPEEYRYYANVDRVDATATVWLGATLRCAQCHNHKYDPYTMKDFYSFLSYFNSTAVETSRKTGSDPTDVSARVTVSTPALVSLQKEATILQTELDRPTEQLAAAQQKWELKQRDPIWSVLEPDEVKSAHGAALSKQVDASVLAPAAPSGADVYTITATTHLTGITAVRIDVFTDSHSSQPGAAPADYAITRLDLTESPLDSANTAKRVAVRNASADFTPDKFPAGYANRENENAKPGQKNVPNKNYHIAVFETARNVGRESGAQLTLRFTRNLTNPPPQTLERFRISVTTSDRPVRGMTVPANIVKILDTTPDNRTPQQAKDLAAFYRSIAPLLESTRGKLTAVRKEIDEYPKTSLVMQELPAPRETHIHARGAFLTLGEKVTPAIPALFGAAPASTPPSRLDLARWLVSDTNPLTARVTVNRIWEQFFGAGIVPTSEDLGTQGEAPANQTLLDWLACELMHPSDGQTRWSLKTIYKNIAMSSTYQQSSSVTPEMLEKDPYNHQFARGPRFRLPAELIRDQALQVSGLLSDKMGGPSVFPLQPEGIWHSPYSGDRWMTSRGEDKYRRGVYTFLRRSAPYPQFMVFDMTTHESICTRRSRTNTALQALTTLNDPSFVQPAAALARRIIAEGGNTPVDRVNFAFRAVLTRSPQPAESSRLVSLYTQMLEKYESDPDSAKALSTSGLSSSAKTTEAPQLAAWTVVSNVLLNLDETLTKE